MGMAGLQHALDDTKLAPVERYFRIFSGPHKVTGIYGYFFLLI